MDLEMADQGTSIFLISSDMSEINLVLDRIIVIYDFEIKRDLKNNRNYEVMSTRIINWIHN